jgi:amino-acid N-acetyltransferase
MACRVELETAATACRGGVDRAHILDGRQGGVLLKESFSNLGVGTMVYADAYEHLRPMELPDVAGILEIMQPLIAEGVLVQRTREDLKRRMKDYWVYDMDGVVHGCAALHIQGGSSAEIAGVAVDPRFAQLGIGTKLISRLSENASEQGIRQLFVLTTHAADWFLARGFREGSINDLPDDRRKEYNASRKSRVLVRDISAD